MEWGQHVAKFSVFERVPAERVREIVPPEYRELTGSAVRAGSQYTVVVFAHDRRNVVASGVVARALHRIGGAATDPILAVGSNFTQEALALLSARGAVPIRLGDFYWTDTSYQEVRRL